MKTMKKIYTSPVAEMLETHPQQLLAGSGYVTDEGNIILSGDNGAADAAEGCAREFQDYVDSFFKVVLVFIMMTAGLALNAQQVIPAGPAPDGKTHGMIIYLKGGSVVNYQRQNLSHVTYLPGIGIKVYQKNATTSVDYLFSQMESIEYAKDGNDNANAAKFSMTDFPEAWRLEYPQLSANVSATGAADNCQVVVKRTDDFGITYSVEWDNAKIANRWTCYQLHEGNSMSTVDRNDDFKADLEVFTSSQLTDYSGSGFSRGHLCPSADRLCSKEQNKQTFFLTNMQPQYQSHNGGLWGRLEEEVRDFATDDSKTDAHCDTLYIVKAATISDKVTVKDDKGDDVEDDGVYKKANGDYDLCNNRLLVPKYFYMALLHYNKATDTYHALAFWTKHIDELQSVKNLGNYAISIKELEKRTGIDFFCNLPDVIEEEVEESIDLDFWHLKTGSE